MPKNLQTALQFLETQWSSINENKVKGIIAEVRFEQHLNSNPTNSLFDYIIPGGWIISPGKNTLINPTTQGRIAILPIPTPFSWTGELPMVPFSAQVLAESYFRQVGLKVYFTRYHTDRSLRIERRFRIPAKMNYQKSYPLEFLKIGSHGLDPVDVTEVCVQFPLRDGLKGMRANKLKRLNRHAEIWRDPANITKLFWKEYSRYFLHRTYYVSSNDLDFFLIGKSGKAYPIEFKSKRVYPDRTLGDWFGIDLGPFTKLSFFISLSNNMEALYFVEEVDQYGASVGWYGVKFTDLLKKCHWVTQSGGKGMGGGASSTVKVPRVVFTELSELLPSL